MSSDQNASSSEPLAKVVSNGNPTRSPTISNGRTSDVPPQAMDIPGFEYELEENISQISSIESVNSVHMPRFEHSRHPNIKLFVVVFAIFGNCFMIYQAFRDLPSEFRSIFCFFFSFETCSDDSDEHFSWVQIVDLLVRGSMEVLIPISVIFSFLFTQLAISMVPGLSHKMRNPVPTLSRCIYITFFFHCFTNILTSISMLPFLGTTPQASYWTEYLIVSGMSLFWMYSLMNMTAFSRLTVHNFIRAKEDHEFRINGQDEMEF